MANKRQREAAKRKRDEENAAGATAKVPRNAEAKHAPKAAVAEQAPLAAGDVAAVKKAAVGKASEDDSKSWTGGRDDGRSSTKQKEFEVCVNGLPFSTTKDTVRRDFSECGEIVNLHLPLDEAGYSRGIAFVQYADQESLDKALAYHESEYGGRRIQVRLSSDKTTGKAKGKGGNRSKEFEVFVGGLTAAATEDALRKDFEECGKIVYCRVPVDDEGSARGIAFIEFADRESVDRALAFDNTEYCGRNIQVRLSSSGSTGKSKDSTCSSLCDDFEGHQAGADKIRKDTESAGKLTKYSSACDFELEVFLHGVPPSTTVECLRNDFSKFGEIANLTLPKNRDGEATGIAFIEFKSQEACVKALALNGTRSGGRLLSVRMSWFNGLEAREGRRNARVRA